MSLRSLKNSTAALFLIISFTASGQKISTTKLPDVLKEVSGLEVLNDSTLIAINDSGNEPNIYLLSFEGNIRRTVQVNNAKNRDWEDLAVDSKHLYIADIGNNGNNRRDLRILKIKLSDLLKKKEVAAQEIKIRYSEQTAYPPTKDSLFFDAESIAVENDTLFLLTKNRNVPWNGNAFIYIVPKEAGDYDLSSFCRLNIGNGSWRWDSATSMDVYRGKWYVLTYSKLQVYKRIGRNLEWEHTYKFTKYTQKESVALTEDYIFVADEKHKLLGGGKLYRVHP